MGNSCRRCRKARGRGLQVNYDPPEEPVADPRLPPSKATNWQELEGKIGPLAKAARSSLERLKSTASDKGPAPDSPKRPAAVPRLSLPGTEITSPHEPAPPVIASPAPPKESPPKPEPEPEFLGVVIPPGIFPEPFRPPPRPKADGKDEFPLSGIGGRTFEIPANEPEVELPRGVKYQGQWVGGKQHGIGLMTYPDGSSYLGEFNEGRSHGFGTYKAADNAMYEGQFVEGKAHGYGVYTFPDGTTFYGSFVQDRRNGRGKEVAPGDFVYLGDFENGFKHGKGEMWAENGEYYKGQFGEGDINGQGTYYWPDGKIYDGLWRQGKQEGIARFQWPDGRIYIGNYQGGRINGEGIMMYRDGRRYEGTFVNGQQDGRGRFYKDPYHYKEGIFEGGKGVEWLTPEWQIDSPVGEVPQTRKDVVAAVSRISHGESVVNTGNEFDQFFRSAGTPTFSAD